MRALILVLLVACRPSYRISIDLAGAGKNTVCLEPGARHEVRARAFTDGRKVDHSRFELTSTIGTFEGSTLVLPDQPLAFVPRLVIRARNRDDDVSTSQQFRTHLCGLSVDLRASEALVRVEVGRVSTRRHGPFALVRVTQAERVWWRIAYARAGAVRNLRLQVSGPVEIFVEDSDARRFVEIEGDDAAQVTTSPGLGATLVREAGGIPPEGEYDPTTDYNPGYVDPERIQSDGASW